MNKNLVISVQRGKKMTMEIRAKKSTVRQITKSKDLSYIILNILKQGRIYFRFGKALTLQALEYLFLDHSKTLLSVEKSKGWDTVLLGG